MKTRMFLAALAVACLFAVGSLRAADEKAELKCPVSGKPALAEHKVAFNGGEVEFCCPNCPKAFNANSAKFAAKANHQLIKSGQLKQIKCPLTGRPVAADKSIDVDGVAVGLCCGGCLKKASGVEGDERTALLLKDTSKGYEPAKK